MAELERILLPILLLIWSLCLGLSIALRRPPHSSQSPQSLKKMGAGSELKSWQLYQPKPNSPSQENPYQAPQSTVASLTEAPAQESAPRSAILLSSRVDLYLALGLIFWYSLLIVLSTSVSAGAEITSAGLMSSLMIQAATILVICALVLRRIAVSPVGLKRWLGLDFTPKQLQQSLIWLLPIIALTYGIHAAVQALLGFLQIELPRQQLVELLGQEQSLGLIFVIAFFAIVIAPLSEELIFRGYLYPVLGRFCGRFAGLLLSASFFGLIHGNLAALIGLSFFGLALCWIYERTGSLWAPIFIHAVFNGIGVIMLISYA